MATVDFDIPDKIKKVFNAVFAGRNKSEIIAELMLRAMEEQRARESRAKAIDRLLARRTGADKSTNRLWRVRCRRMRLAAC